MNIFKKKRIMKTMSMEGVTLKDFEESLIGKTTEKEFIEMLEKTMKEKGVTREDVQKDPSLGWDLYIDTIKANIKK